MKKFIILAIAVFLVVLIYRGWGSGADESASVTPITIALAAQNRSGEIGQAVITEVDGQVKVALTITGGPTGVSQPAHIHYGRCATLGEPVYALSPVTDGVSDTTLTASLIALKSSLPLAINVHKSVADLATYVACGDIVLK